MTTTSLSEPSACTGARATAPAAFPMTPTTLQHRHGGKIVKVHGVAHCACSPEQGRSRDYWYFDCDVLWDDSSTVDRHEVEPYKLACDDPPSNTELASLMTAMTSYLHEHGARYDSGPHEGWYAHRKGT